MENGKLTASDKLILECCTKGIRSKESEANPFKNALMETLWAIARHRVTKGGIVVDGEDRTPPEWNKCLADIDIVIEAIAKRARDAVLADLNQGKLDLQTESKPAAKRTTRSRAVVENAWNSKEWINATEAKNLLRKDINQLHRLAMSGKCMMRLSDSDVMECRKTDTFEEHETLFRSEGEAGSPVPMVLWGNYVADRQTDSLDDFNRHIARNPTPWKHYTKVNRVNFVKLVQS